MRCRQGWEPRAGAFPVQCGTQNVSTCCDAGRGRTLECESSLEKRLTYSLGVRLLLESAPVPIAPRPGQRPKPSSRRNPPPSSPCLFPFEYQFSKIRTQHHIMLFHPSWWRARRIAAADDLPLSVASSVWTEGVSSIGKDAAQLIQNPLWFRVAERTIPTESTDAHVVAR